MRLMSKFKPIILLCILGLIIFVFRKKGHNGQTESIPEKKSVTEQDTDGARRGKIASGLNSSNLAEELVKVAFGIAEKRGLVLFAVINDGYFDLAASWLCNTAVLGRIHQHVLFLATDVTTGQRLHQMWPEVSVVSTDSSHFSGAHNYGKAGYVRLVVERVRYINYLVQAEIPMLLFETDFVWLADPLPTILSLSQQTKADIVATKAHKTHIICGCFLLLNPTPAIRKVWKRLTKGMEELGQNITNKAINTSVSNNYQGLLTSLVTSREIGARVSYLWELQFPDGKWYNEKEQLRTGQALVIHNNWIISNAAKAQRAKKFGHWFLKAGTTGSNVTCDMDAVRKLIGLAIQ